MMANENQASSCSKFYLRVFESLMLPVFVAKFSPGIKAWTFSFLYLSCLIFILPLYVAIGCPKDAVLFFSNLGSVPVNFKYR